MMNSATSFTKPLITSKIPQWLIYAMLVTGFIGFLDATYLAVKHYLGTPVVCSIWEGCEIVTTSSYSIIAGVPVALFGAIYYLLVFLLVIVYLSGKRERILDFVTRFTILGFGASLWFVYIQIFILKAICLYCMVSALTSTILFILGLLIIRLKKQKLLRIYVH